MKMILALLFSGFTGFACGWVTNSYAVKMILVALVVGFTCGWVTNNWRHESRELKETLSIVKLQQNKDAISQKSGKQLEDVLTQQRKNDAEFDEKLNKAIQISPDTVCFNDDFIGLFNDKINRSKTVLSGKLAR